jgi:hypothetical protein
MAAGDGAKCSLASVERVCENCGGEDDDLVAVHRLYVVPESWDSAGGTSRVEATELWCFSCRSMYPHEVADGDGAPDQA